MSTPAEEAAGAARWRRRILAAGSLALGIALFVLVLWLGGEEMLAALREAALAPLALAFVISLLLYPLAAWRWAAITNHLAGEQVASYALFLKMRAMFAAGGLLAPRELVEFGGRTLWLVRNCGQPMTRAVKGVFIDRICDIVLSLIALAGALGYWLLGLEAALSAGLMIGATCASVLLLPWLFHMIAINLGRLSALFERLERLKLLGAFVAKLKSAVTLEPRIWRMALFLSLLKWTVLVARAVLLAMAVKLTLSPFVLINASPIGQLANVIAITPGGFGIYELGWFGILVYAGGGVAAASAFVVLLRLSVFFSIFAMAPLMGVGRQRLEKGAPAGRDQGHGT